MAQDKVKSFTIRDTVPCPICNNPLMGYADSHGIVRPRCCGKVWVPFWDMDMEDGVFKIWLRPYNPEEVEGVVMVHKNEIKAVQTVDTLIPQA